MIEFRWGKDPATLRSAFELRRQVFVTEQHVTEAEELDGRESEATTEVVIAAEPADPHLALATARVLFDHWPESVHVGRVAVRADRRGSGIGAALMGEIHQRVRARLAIGQRTVIALSAQVNAIGFYRRLGYDISPEPYLDARIWHQDATVELVNPHDPIRDLQSNA